MSKNYQRYKLHRIIKNEGYKYNAHKKIIFIPYTQTEQLTESVRALMKIFNYKVQTEMFE